MKASTTPAPELSWAQVHAFRLRRHHLGRMATREDLVRVAGDVGGFQAQVMSAAELQAAVRSSCAVNDVRDALWKERTLVKTWLMRGTLHLIPADDLPLYTAAMRTRWIRTRPAWLKYMQVTMPQLVELFDDIAQELDGTPKTRAEILERVGHRHPNRVRETLSSGWGGLLKPVARSGLLCFGPSRGQNVTFVRPSAWLGTWRELDPDAALVEVARRYLRAYGPATKADFTRWWGNWPGVGSAAWGGLAQELTPVSVEGARLDLLTTDLESIARAEPDELVVMLPAFDPYLMGHASRAHLVAREHAPRVSRVAGWISPVVLVRGRVVATWTHTVAANRMTVRVDALDRIRPSARAAVRERAGMIARALGVARAEVEFA